LLDKALCSKFNTNKKSNKTLEPKTTNNQPREKMKKKGSPFIKVRRNMFNSKELARLMTKEGTTGDIFSCWIVSKSMHFGTDLIDNRVASELPFDNTAVATDLQPSSIHLPYVRTGGRTYRDRDNTSTPSVVEVEVAVEGAFLEFWNEIFTDPLDWFPYSPIASSPSEPAPRAARIGLISVLDTG
jgi:hypothetical protein